jgi:hypothetical protein
VNKNSWKYEPSPTVYLDDVIRRDREAFLEAIRLIVREELIRRDGERLRDLLRLD